MASPSDVAPLLVELCRSRPATLGRGRLLCLDGPAGAGKTTLAEATAGLEPGTTVVHVDDLLDGWRGLPTVAQAVDALLRPLSRGEPGHYRRYDWDAGEWAETVRVDPSPLLVLEGCGAGSRAYADLATLIVWVDAPADLRVARGLARDGAHLLPRWDQWLRDEEELFALEGTRARADVEVDGTGVTAPVLRQAP
jgi:uridine kinase